MAPLRLRTHKMIHFYSIRIKSVLGATALLSVFGMFGQEREPAVEAATVKPSRSTGGINNRRDPVIATWTNIPLSVLIGQAYRILRDQLIAGPSWLDSDRWDVVIKTDLPSTRGQQWKMLQPLLAERFRLKVHWETRQVPQYELVPGNHGPKVPEDSGEAAVRIGPGAIDARAVGTAEFVSALRGELGRPVIDHTGLKGKYDFKLQWTPDETHPNNPEEPVPTDLAGPTIFAAIQELGFKLRAIRGPLEVLVIDHVEKPSEN